MDVVAILTGHVRNEPSNGLFLWLTSRSQKPPLKWYHRHKNSHNTTVQLQTPIGSRDNHIRLLVKFTNSKHCMYARFAASFHCACHTSSVVFSTVPISTSLLRCLRYCFLLTKDCMHNEVWGCAETLPKLTLLQPQERPISIPQKVKFPHGPILHYAFSSWIEKTRTKTIPCDWENRFVLQ